MGRSTEHADLQQERLAAVADIILDAFEQGVRSWDGANDDRWEAAAIVQEAAGTSWSAALRKVDAAKPQEVEAAA